jgi:hypothetical protein
VSNPATNISHRAFLLARPLAVLYQPLNLLRGLPLSAKLLKNGTLKIYKDFPHGMPTTKADTINSDLLEFIRKPQQTSKQPEFQNRPQNVMFTSGLPAASKIQR